MKNYNNKTQAGKGDKPRKIDLKKYRVNYTKIFKK